MSYITDVILTMTSVEDTGTSDCPVWPAVEGSVYGDGLTVGDFRRARSLVTR